MSYTNLSDFKAALRDFDGIATLDATYQRALDAAEGTVAKFIGFDPDAEFDTVPPEIVSAAYVLAAIEVDALDVPTEQQRRARAESLLRPFRRETGIAGAGVAA